MDLKLAINRILGVTGYGIHRRRSLRVDLARGRYTWLQQKNIATVLDVGANTGQFAAMARSIFPTSMIYSFEPLDTCFRELEAKSVAMQPTKCFNVALGRQDGTNTINRNEFSASSSMLPLGERHTSAFPFAKETTPVQITVRSLDSIAEELTLKGPILMKVDVQGFEMEVLAGATRTLELVDILVLETSFVELYAGQPLFDEIYRFLQPYRFSYAGSVEQIQDPHDGTILYADSVFIRR
jgi:FkbM family methyltransferase